MPVDPPHPHGVAIVGPDTCQVILLGIKCLQQQLHLRGMLQALGLFLVSRIWKTQVSIESTEPFVAVTLEGGGGCCVRTQRKKRELRRPTEKTFNPTLQLLIH